MSTKRVPMSPPDLPGFTYVELLGSGGFADVFLYEQHLPRRRVAVKVLLPERMSGASAEEFTSEANVMAMLSTHPAIVTIHQAGVAGDGRPYLVMEYCPRPNLQVRYRREPFSVAEALRVGIQVAAAVETAHRAGVLHRDIKPANILVTEYNRPALTDFGIATTAGGAESAGMSIPWSPPESFSDAVPAGRPSDVYALAATVYTLLAARSPFELPGRRNAGVDLIERIESSPLPPLARADVPLSLQRVLERAMAKAPADRHETALAFARALQQVQIELAHSVTPIDILDDAAHDDLDEDDEDGLTRVRGVVSIDPETTPAGGLTRPSDATRPRFPSADEVTTRAALRREATTAPLHAETTRTARREAEATAETILRVPPPHPVEGPPSFASPGDRPARDVGESSSPAREKAPTDAARPRRGVWWTLGGSVVLVAAAVIAGVTLPGLFREASPDRTPAPQDTSVRPQDPLLGVVAAPTDLAGVAAGGEVTFTWTNPDPQDADAYQWGVVTRADQDPVFDRVGEPTVTVPADPSGTTCIEVLLVRANGSASDPVRGCVP